ncbi:MAG: hypothetical protein H0W08_07380, partial [Acidobacteria bacterium]|nr:hypothetical protein [Acidobacteriota bacterium]
MIDLPLFDDRHRALDARLRANPSRFDPVTSTGEAGDVDGAAHQAIAICAQLGLCRLLVPPELGGDGADLRSLC